MAGMIAPLEVGICCGDLDRLVQFYVEILDARWISTTDVPAEKACEAFGSGSSSYRVARVELPTGERLKFLQPAVPPQVQDRSLAVLPERNATYLTFIVDDLGAARERLEQSGAPILTGSEAVVMRPGVSIIFSTDPEGNLIEFVRYDDLSLYRPS